MEYTSVAQLAREAGFAHMAPLDPATIELKTEVRQMCQACHQYEKRWSCPPGCGELDACRGRIAEYKQGILVQTVGQLEDDFDAEAMMETEASHKEHFTALRALLAQRGIPVLPLGAGCCTVCKDCTYPDNPCRFPEKCISSMEAFGMVVTEVCKANSMPYYHGKNTIAYTSCVLFDRV